MILLCLCVGKYTGCNWDLIPKLCVLPCMSGMAGNAVVDIRSYCTIKLMSARGISYTIVQTTGSAHPELDICLNPEPTSFQHSGLHCLQLHCEQNPDSPSTPPPPRYLPGNQRVRKKKYLGGRGFKTYVFKFLELPKSNNLHLGSSKIFPKASKDVFF